MKSKIDKSNLDGFDLAIGVVLALTGVLGSSFILGAAAYVVTFFFMGGWQLARLLIHGN